MPERICEICDSPKSPVVINVATFRDPEGTYETGQWECTKCSIEMHIKARDHWATIANELQHLLTKKVEECQYWKSVAENLYRSINPESAQSQNYEEVFKGGF